MTGRLEKRCFRGDPRRRRGASILGVQVVRRWIVAALRKQKFFSLGEVNQAIAGLLTKLNRRPFRKREGGSASLFAQLDRPARRPLPATRFEFGQWKTTRVDLDYHVERDRRHYSVPHALARQRVDVRSTADTAEVFRRGVRVSSHVVSAKPGEATTATGHMPKSHRKYVRRTPSGLLEEAQRVGPSTGQLVEATLIGGAGYFEAVR